jgi:hypothetical protein
MKHALTFVTFLMLAGCVAPYTPLVVEPLEQRPLELTVTSELAVITRADVVVRNSGNRTIFRTSIPIGTPSTIQVPKHHEVFVGIDAYTTVEFHTKNTTTGKPQLTIEPYQESVVVHFVTIDVKKQLKEEFETFSTPLKIGLLKAVALYEITKESPRMLFDSNLAKAKGARRILAIEYPQFKDSQFDYELDMLTVGLSVSAITGSLGSDVSSRLYMMDKVMR